MYYSVYYRLLGGTQDLLFVSAVQGLNTAERIARALMEDFRLIVDKSWTEQD